MEIEKLEAEKTELEAKISYYKKLLNEEEELKKFLKEELKPHKKRGRKKK